MSSSVRLVSVLVISAVLTVAIFISTVLAATTIYRYPPQGWSNQSANFSGTSYGGGCTANWSFTQDVDDVYAYYYSDSMEVRWSQLRFGSVSGNDDIWWYLVSWVYGDGPADAFYHYSQFEASSPVFEPGSEEYSYEENNGVVIQTNIGEFGISGDCDAATSWLVLWGPNN